LAVIACLCLTSAYARSQEESLKIIEQKIAEYGQTKYELTGDIKYLS
jgi:hypothetical protein